MSWTKYPGTVCLPTLLPGYSVTDFFFSSNYKLRFFLNWGYYGKYIISNKFFPSLSVDSDTFSPVLTSMCNGRVFWENGDRKIYYDSVFGKYVLGTFVPGYHPAYWYTGSEYLGDPFWTGDLPSNLSSHSWFLFDGTERNTGKQKNLEVKFIFPRYESSAPCGVYKEVDGNKEVTFGSPYWTDQNGKTYCKSAQYDEKNGYRYSYGDLIYSSGTWRTDTHYSTSGEPEKEKDLTLKPYSEDGYNLNLSFRGYCIGDSVKKCYIFEAATWK